MKRLAFLAAAACLSGCVLTGTGRAEMITYTMTATGSGSLGTQQFTDALVTMTATGDTANVTNPGSGIFLIPLTATLTVAGIPGTATFSSTIEVQDRQDIHALWFLDTGDSKFMLETLSSAFDNYDLTTSLGPISGPNREASFPHSTDQGEFIFSAAPAGATFEATLAAPEPASLTLLGLGIAGLAGYCCRRRQRNV